MASVANGATLENLTVDDRGASAQDQATAFLISDPMHKWRLLAKFVLYFLPCLASALYLGVVFLKAQRSFNRVYFADLVGSGLCGSIYVMCPPMIGEFAPVSQRGAVISIYGALYTLAGIIAPLTMGAVIKHAATPMEGYTTGFTINAVIMVASGLLGLLLLWPNTERARLTGGDAPQAAALKRVASPT